MGKSTQIPQFVAYDEYASGLGVVCTQPRVLAAKRIAERAADKMGVTLGEQVGYHVRFEKVVSKATRITYMTEGVLVRQALNDAQLSAYSWEDVPGGYLPPK